MAKAQLLIVEDERIIAMDLEHQLREMGYDVIGVVASGEQALQRASQRRPDLALLDIMLDGKMDGIQVGDELRNRFRVPIIYLTAYADDKTLERAKRTEPSGYLVKPYNEKELRAAVEMALYRHPQEERIRKQAQWFTRALNGIGEAVFMANEKGDVTFRNAAAELLAREERRHGLVAVSEQKPEPNVDRLPLEDQLSQREKEVLDLFLRGFGTATMASRLYVSPHTIRNHLKNICRKLNVTSQVELRELFAVGKVA